MADFLITRRGVLAGCGAALLFLAGCGDSKWKPKAPPAGMEEGFLSKVNRISGTKLEFTVAVRKVDGDPEVKVVAQHHGKPVVAVYRKAPPENDAELLSETVECVHEDPAFKDAKELIDNSNGLVIRIE